MIIIPVIFYYFYYSFKEKWQKQFIKYGLFAFLCIGLHQFFEFLSLLTENIIVYKIGLIISIFAIYFSIKSAEILGNVNFKSKYAFYLIMIVSLHIILTPLKFTEGPFYLRHMNAFFWIASWMFMFIYWHVCIYKIWKKIKSTSRKILLRYAFFTADISFLLSIVYTIFGYIRYSTNVCTDTPSIWCTFFVIQGFFVPLLLIALPKFIRPKKWKLSNKKFTVMILISLLILALMIFILPFFNCLSWKFMFP